MHMTIFDYPIRNREGIGNAWMHLQYMVPKGIGAKLFRVGKTGVSSWTNTDS